MLPHEIDEEAFTKHPEVIQNEYVKQGEMYFLQTSGLVPKGRLDEFRTNNIKLMNTNTELAKAVDAFGGVTAEEFEAIKAKAEKQGDGITPEELEKLVKTETGKRIEKMTTEHGETVDGLTAKLNTSNSKLSKVLIDDALKSAGIKGGVSPEGLEDFIARGNKVFRLIDGVSIPMDGEEIIYGKDAKTALSMDDWTAELSSSAKHLFGKTTSQMDKSKIIVDGASGSKLTGIEKMRAARA